MTPQSKLWFVGLGAFLLGAAVVLLVVGIPSASPRAEETLGLAAAGESKQLWSCSMHPHVISDKPGNCRICGMRLGPVGASSPTADVTTATPQGEREILYWRAPMDPDFTSDKPGKSPMGMDLVPFYADEVGAAGTVRVDPNFLQNFAVRTAVVERGNIPLEVRTIGVLSHNEENLISVNTKFEGWIEKAYFNNVGEYVREGAVLFEVYSPELITTQQEYLAALEYVERLEGTAYREAVERARSLLEAAHKRLLYWDISEEQIQQLEREREVHRTLKVYAPTSGFIVAKMGDSLEGMRLTPGMTALK